MTRFRRLAAAALGLPLAATSVVMTGTSTAGTVNPATTAPSATASAPAAAATTAAVLPRTGFEQRAGSRWTTLAEEQTYLRALDAASERVTVSRIGTSVRGRPIQLITVGPAKTKAEIASGSSLLLVCTQHGDEPAGREACLQQARALAAAADARTVLIVPTANPDGLAATTRGNGNGTDINRDHQALKTPEARAIAAVIRTYKPDIVHDLHEYSASAAYRFKHQGSQGSGVEERIRTLAVDLGSRYVAPTVQSAGFQTGLWPSGSHTGILRNAAGLHRSVGLLAETPRRGTLTRVQRVRAHRAAVAGSLKMLRERRGDLAAATG